MAPREVEIDIVDDGHSAPPPRPPAQVDGHGLIGMRERMAMYGGELSAAPRAEGGFRVHARLPFEPGGDASWAGPAAPADRERTP